MCRASFNQAPALNGLQLTWAGLEIIKARNLEEPSGKARRAYGLRKARKVYDNGKRLAKAKKRAKPKQFLGRNVHVHCQSKPHVFKL